MNFEGGEHARNRGGVVAVHHHAGEAVPRRAADLVNEAGKRPQPLYRVRQRAVPFALARIGGGDGHG